VSIRRRRRSAVLAVAALAALGCAAVSFRLDAAPSSKPAIEAPGPKDPSEAAVAGNQAGAEQPNRHQRQSLRLAATGPAQSFARYRVFTTQYEPNTAGAFEAAVPDKCVKFAALGNSSALSSFGCPAGYTIGADYRVLVQRDNGNSAFVPVREVGPWNIDDNYWNPLGGPRPRRIFRDLPQGTPEAQAAYYNGYNTVANCKNLDGSPSGRTAGADQFGRCVLNPPGMDLSRAAAAQLGIAGNEWVTVTYMWEPAVPISKPAVIRGGKWFLRQSLTTGPADFSFGYGDSGDKPLLCDWNGDGVKTPGVFRDGWFYVRNSVSTGTANASFPYGNAGDIPLCGDWNGDGTDTVGVQRGSTRYLRNSNTSGHAEISYVYGDPGDVPLAGDWDGNGTDTPGVFRNGHWYLRNSNTTGTAELGFQYGNARDLPVTGDWNGDRIDAPGVVRRGVWYMRNTNNAGNADFSFGYGDAGDTPRIWR
jgi:hypothetical protein